MTVYRPTPKMAEQVKELFVRITLERTARGDAAPSSQRVLLSNLDLSLIALALTALAEDLAENGPP